jgi:hypothetical protein
VEKEDERRLSSAGVPPVLLNFHSASYPRRQDAGATKPFRLRYAIASFHGNQISLDTGILAGRITPRQDHRQESSSVPAKQGQRFYGELHRLGNHNTIREIEVNRGEEDFSSIQSLRNCTNEETNCIRCAWQRCGCGAGWKKNDGGRVRSDRWEIEASGTATPYSRCHIRSKCAAHPCCRTKRNARAP